MARPGFRNRATGGPLLIRPATGPCRPLWRAAATGAALISTAGTFACSSALPKSIGAAPVLSIATGLWPLAQVARQIGGDKAAVVDVVPPATNPFTFQPNPSQTRIMTGSGLVLEIGSGFQPGVEAAAVGAPVIARIAGSIGARDPYVWLDPATMGKAVSAIERAMAAADPGAAPLFQRNASDLQNEIQSLGIDYSSTLSACPGTSLVTPDDAFTATASAYGLTDRVVRAHPAPAQVNAEKVEIQAGRATGVIAEPWVDNSGVEQVAAAAGVRTHSIDTLATTPTSASGTGQDPYFASMEAILGQLTKALGCSTSEQ
jgi:zinc transport system substrate-binding protein